VSGFHRRVGFWLAALLSVVLQIGCERANALVSSEADLLLILHAKSVEELEQSALNAVQTSTERDACEAELKLNVLPRSCFRESKIEGRAPASWLVKECVQRAQRSSSRLDLGQENTELPDKCRLAAQERFEDLNYLDQAERPSELWRLERKVK
jgi:hypothetical protein